MRHRLGCRAASLFIATVRDLFGERATTTAEQRAPATQTVFRRALLLAGDALGGDLDRVKRCVKLGIFVNSMPDFTDQPKVGNGASELMEQIFGEAGRHTGPTRRERQPSSVIGTSSAAVIVSSASARTPMPSWERMRSEIADLQEQVGAPDLWDDQANAQRVTGRLSVLQADLERITGLPAHMINLRGEEDQIVDTTEAEEAWSEVPGVRIEDFRLDNVRARIARLGDLWKPLVAVKGRTDLGTFLTPRGARRRA